MQNKKASRAYYMQAMVWFLGIFFVAGMGYAVHIAVNSVLGVAIYENDIYRLQEVEVVLDRHSSLTRKEIIQQSGVYEGCNLVKLNLTEVHQNLKKIPSIESVRVQREIPNTLKLVVKERKPVALLKPHSATGSRLAQEVYYIDAKGYVMKPRPGERINKNLTKITGVLSDDVIEGERINREEVLSALDLLRLSDLYALRGELDLEQIAVESRGYLILRTLQNGYIRFRSDVLDQQIERLLLILNHSRRVQKYVRTVDLTPQEKVPVTYF